MELFDIGIASFTSKLDTPASHFPLFSLRYHHPVIEKTRRHLPPVFEFFLFSVPSPPAPLSFFILFSYTSHRVLLLVRDACLILKWLEIVTEIKT